MYGNPGKLLMKRQGLLIPSYRARKDYDYLHVLPRPVVALVANAASPFSNPVSFARVLLVLSCKAWESCVDLPK